MKKILLLVFIFTMPAQIHAQWELCNGPYGGSIYKFAVHDSIIFTVTRTGFSAGSVFLSTNSGKNWKQLGSGLETKMIADLAISADGSEIFALSDSGVFYSTNNGAGWSNIGPKFSGLNKSIAVYGNDSGGTNVIVGTYSNGIFLSRDLGKSWEQPDSNFKPDIHSICVIGSRIFACTWGQGLYFSTNDGKNWEPASFIPEGQDDILAVLRVIVGPDSASLFACTYWAGVYVSKDNGENWTAVNSGLMNRLVNCLALAGKNLFAGTDNGVFRSSNDGTSWQYAGLKGIEIAEIAVQSSGDESRVNLFAGAHFDKGIFLSTDLGESWTEANQGITNLNIEALAVYEDEAGFARLFAGARGLGISKSTDNGESWTKADSGLPPNRIPLSFAYNNSKMFVRTDSGLFISSDYGNSWTDIGSGLPVGQYGNKIFVSSDTTGRMSIFAGTVRGLYRSIDTGKSWIEVNSGLPISGETHSKSRETHTTAFAQMGPFIFIGFRSYIFFENQSYGGLFRSSDNGANWTKLSQGLPENSTANDIAVMGKNIFAAINEEVFLSTDNGTSWKNITPASPGLTGANSFAVNKANLFAASGNSVYLTADKGTSWKDISQGLPAFLSWSHLTNSSTHLFIGIPGYGVGRLLLSGIAAEIDGPYEVPVKFSLEQNYPNPFNPTTKIKYSIPRESKVTICVYNTLGEEVGILVNETLKAGIHEVNFNPGSLSSGVYFYQIRTGNYVQTKKMVLLH